jgi:hypothetical protein
MGWRRARITGRTGKVAPVGYFYQRKAAMLLMVRAYTTVIWAPIDCLCMGLLGIFTGLIVVSDLFVILDVYGNQYFLKTMFLAGFGKVDIPLLKNDLGTQLPVTFDAKTDGMVVVNIVAFIFHVA